MTTRAAAQLVVVVVVAVVVVIVILDVPFGSTRGEWRILVACWACAEGGILMMATTALRLQVARDGDDCMHVWLICGLMVVWFCGVWCGWWRGCLVAYLPVCLLPMYLASLNGSFTTAPFSATHQALLFPSATPSYL